MTIKCDICGTEQTCGTPEAVGGWFRRQEQRRSDDWCPTCLAKIDAYIAAKCPELGKPAEASGEPDRWAVEGIITTYQTKKGAENSYPDAKVFPLYRHHAPARVAALEKLAEAVKKLLPCAIFSGDRPLAHAYDAFEKSQSAPVAEDWRSKCTIESATTNGGYAVFCRNEQRDEWLTLDRTWGKWSHDDCLFGSESAARAALAAAPPPPGVK